MALERTYDNKKRLHSFNDKPACIQYAGYNYVTHKTFYKYSWYNHGKIHRDGDKPAIIVGYNATGRGRFRMWYSHGRLHRLNDKPAIIKYENNKCIEKEWWYRGNMHRENNKPAHISEHYNHWYYKGKRHRLDGPATIQFYYSSTNQRNIYTEDWFKDDELHRIDGPAHIKYSPSGVKLSEGWFVNGNYHRLDGPACIENNYRYSWYKDGSLHRTDGPAIYEKNNKQKYWFINGNHITNAVQDMFSDMSKIKIPLSKELETMLVMSCS